MHESSLEIIITQPTRIIKQYYELIIVKDLRYHGVLLFLRPNGKKKSGDKLRQECPLYL